MCYDVVINSLLGVYFQEADKKRRDEFKTYEMEKRFEEEQRLAHIEDEQKREEERKKVEELKQKHKKHETPHHPMTQDQLEEVWEETDHMPKEEFDPKTFFTMHDLDGNGFLDEDEVKVRKFMLHFVNYTMMLLICLLALLLFRVVNAVGSFFRLSSPKSWRRCTTPTPPRTT